jgi:hypothetical protein
MGGFVHKGGQVERLTLRPGQLEEIARILGITQPEQVQGISIHTTRQPGPSTPPGPSARAPARRRPRRRQQE